MEGENAVTPVKSNLRGKFVSSGQKLMIINFYKDKMIKEKNVPDGQKLKYKDLLKFISKYLGIGTRTIATTLSEYKNKGTISSPKKTKSRKTIVDKVDDFEKSAIRQKIYSFWVKKEIPTSCTILSAINDDPTLPNFSGTSLRRILKDLNFEYTKRSRNSALTERRDIVCWRRKYLESIKHYRQQGRPIYYLDETWINAGETTKYKVRVDKTVTSDKDRFLRGLATGQKSQGKCLIVLHIGSSEGFVPGGLSCFESKKTDTDCHDEMNGETFFDWFNRILPLLKKNAVIVMDNASYHLVKKNPVPVIAWRKQQIIEWLEIRGEIIDRPMVKRQLMEKVNELRPVHDQYVTDELAKDNQNIVLRLPPYHCELNPMELAWSSVRNYVEMNNSTFKLPDVQKLLIESIERVTPEMWNNFVGRVMKEEEKIWNIDFITDELLDNEHTLTITGETTSESEDENDE